MKKHTAEPCRYPLTLPGEAAARIRSIATRAAEEYRRRNEPVPDYVKDAMQAGLGSRKTRLSKTKPQVNPPLQTVSLC